MTETPSIVIVGAGAAGLSTALQLAERGCRDVTVIDRDHVAAGSSSLSAGIFTRQYTDPFDVALRVEAYAGLERLERDAGLVLRRNGFARLAHDDATLERFGEGAALQRELGVEDARVLDRTELARLVPDLRCDDLAGALFSPSDGYLDGQQLCMTYAERAEGLGVAIRGRHALTGYEPLADGRHRLITSRGELTCDVVVNAAGAWAETVGTLLDAPVRITAERHQACIMHLDTPLPYELPSIMDYVAGDHAQGIYLRPEGERQLLVGLHGNHLLDDEGVDADDYYGGADAAFVDELIPALMDRMPGFDEIGLGRGWSGLYPHSADDDFVIGPFPGREGVFAVCGLHGVGIYMSPVVGRIAADWVLHGRPASDAEARAFAPARLEAARHA